MTGHLRGASVPEPPPDTVQDAPTAGISQDRMRLLLRGGHAVALLEGCFPVPATYAGTWWHIPTDHPAQHYLPAPPEHAARYAQLAARRRVAHNGITAADPIRTGRTR